MSTRTQDQPATQHAHTNRLIDETSPYLLQHAHNPVDWYPWGEEAFEKARREDKPIFLSIGYSTCYWCHVMERESFEDDATAAVLNEHFVPIKVDREERPDVDDIYMTAVQMMTGRGGWPMSMFLEPEQLRPFYGGTYFPPEPRHGLPSFTQLLEAIDNAWNTKRDEIDESAESIAGAVRDHLGASAPPVAVTPAVIEQAAQQLMSTYEQQHGGFGQAPKFPQPVFLEFLIGARDDVSDSMRQQVDQALTHTLDRMALGGMYDQVGGGFHRYSTDARWLVPHFEKMLYDNGQLASVYARAHKLYGDPFYAEVVRETLSYIEREMTDPENGAFYSAQDAEVNAREGENYVWTPDEVRTALDDAGLGEHTDFALHVYGLDQGTNFQDPHHPDESPTNVVYLTDRPETLAEKHDLSIDAFNSRLDRINDALLKARLQRDQPGTDDKILTAWNGLMIAGFADAGRLLDEHRFVAPAARAADFILDTMRTEDGGLLRSHRAGESKVDAFLEDYAMFIRGLIALHRASGDPKWLSGAIELAGEARERFVDESSRSFYDTLANQSDLFVRTRTIYDGAVPSGNAVMLNNLVSLHEITGESVFLDNAVQAARGLSAAITRQPVASIHATHAVDRLLAISPDRLAAEDVVARGEAPFDKVGGVAGDPVRVTASIRELSVPAGETLSCNLILLIDDGFHITAHEPGDAALTGLEVTLRGGDGWSLDVEYAEGEEYTSAAVTSPIRVHEGEMFIPVSVSAPPDAGGSALLSITWQACTDRECLPPASKQFEIKVIHD